nr:MAG TPA: hypothetical protein [Inoviridae sp.]
MIQIELSNYVSLFSGGVACGLLLSFIPFAIGKVVSLAIKIMKS